MHTAAPEKPARARARGRVRSRAAAQASRCRHVSKTAPEKNFIFSRWYPRVRYAPAHSAPCVNALFIAARATRLVKYMFNQAAHAPPIPGGIGLGQWLGGLGNRLLGVFSLPLSLTGDTPSESVFRYMSDAELKATNSTGLARGGRDGITFATNDVYYTSDSAQKALRSEERRVGKECW